ncbi:MAG: peptide chain release factor N(5)-glutamine methyltransferase [Pseudomonadota bacterium]
MVVPLHLRPRSGPYSGLTLRSAKRFLARQFADADLPFADEDALDLLLSITGLSRTDYTLKGTDFISEAAFDALQAAAQRRLSGEPVDRILGFRDFYGRRFVIDNVLSPRGDTEVLLLAALDAVRDRSAPQLLDLGTGSGALAISILCERPDARVTATDLSRDALETAARNAETHGVADRLTLIRSDWFASLPEARYDAILSNPPYITTQAMTSLSREVSEHDPHQALHGGTDGLDPYRSLIPGSVAFLKRGGWLGVEIGHDQRDAVMSLLCAANFARVESQTDPAGLDRLVSGVRPV